MLRFGAVEFEEGGGGLRVGGVSVELDRNCRAILLLLLREAGSEVSKERLLQAGWPDRIVHANSLAKAIARLRVVLGQDGEAIQTVYGIGYKLDAAVKRAADASVDPGRVEETTAPEPVHAPSGHGTAVFRRPAFWAGTVGLLGLGALAAAAEAGFLTRQSAESQFRATPPIIADAPDAIGRILWVDDNPTNNSIERRLFEERRLSVHPVTSSDDARKLLAIYDYDMIISDMGRGDDRLAGIRLAEDLRASGDQTQMIIYTVRPEKAEQRAAQRQLVRESGANGLAVTPKEVRAMVLEFFGNPEPRPEQEQLPPAAGPVEG